MAELVVAMVIITVVLLSLMAVQTSALVTVAEAGRRQQATAYLNETMEQLRAMPWAVIERGLAGNFLAASGGDPNVSGSTLILDGTPETLIVAPATGAGSQDLSSSWSPLYDGSGSNVTVKTLASEPGIQFTVRTYTVEGLGDPGSVGLTVLVEWVDLSTGDTSHLVSRTTAYAPNGGCGDLSTQPFQSSCQDRYSAYSSSGEIVTTVLATDNAPGTSQRPLLPGNSQYGLTLRSSETTADVASQQITNVKSGLSYGGGIVANVSGDAILSDGFFTVENRASDDTASVNTPGKTNSKSQVPSTASLRSYNSSTDGRFDFDFQSDLTHSGSLYASVENSCTAYPGLPAGQPCATSNMTNGKQYMARFEYSPGASDKYTVAIVDRGTGYTEYTSWAGRYLDAIGQSSTGCTTLSGSGCTAAGSKRAMDDIRFADPAGGPGWDDAASGTTDGAEEGIVRVENYRDEVRVERGASQTTTDPYIDREARLYYWNGTGYSYVDIDEDSDFNIDAQIPELTWTSGSSGALSVTATTTVNVTPQQWTEVDDDPTCQTEICKVSASAGSITVSTSYVMKLVTATGTIDYTMTASSVITGAEATASYRAVV